MKIIRWILVYPIAIGAGSMLMLWLHDVSGQLIPEASMELLPMDDLEAMKSHIQELPSSAKWAVMVSHWLGTAFAAFLAMLVAPLSREWIQCKPLLRASFPGWVLGVVFFFAGAVNAAMIPLPKWMLLTDLAGYLPAAFVASYLAMNARKS